MYFQIDDNGTLNIGPDNYSDVVKLINFLRGLSKHGAKVINVETNFEDYMQEDRQPRQEHNPRAFGFAKAHHPEPIYDPEPFSPQMVNDGRGERYERNSRDYGYYPREYGERGGNSRSDNTNEIRGERGGENPGPYNPQDRERNR